MRVHYFALTVAFLVASSAATSTSTESELIAPRLADEESFSTKRLLRTHKTFAAAEKEEEEEERVFGIKLPANLGGIGLSKKAAAAMKSAAIPTKQEAAQISRWLDNGLSPLEVMDAQRLSKAGAGFFDSPQFATWSHYLTAYNTKHPRKQVTVLEVLKKGYGEEGVLKLLASVDDGPGATKFKNEVVKSWLADPDHPANMFQGLKLDKAGDDLISNPLLSVWTMYVKAFKTEYPFTKSTVIETLTKAYGDEKLATMIQAGTKVEKTEQFAKDLQTAQFKHWVTENKTPENIYKNVLKVD
ncbi:hypothetical protein PF010_g11964 [Phytophthora fragariae]|nr:hypothetical protein PF003_g13629 [Phytophthora fragariae]KAE8936455.1 hypothetical protein PF009_g13623 [Phytophthora fragariae]KAE9108288.1 hypothetical protein PF010_g11964 [Phytophthora fragariae]KAE9108467.1 hypothetical protein PF007_g12639 [Phytophthora fragariae]KAE9143319.1 hypothetical protein PF006_g11641 [Phytophthora fragariae]